MKRNRNATQQELAERIPKPKAWASVDEMIYKHPVYIRYRPEGNSQLGRALTDWAEALAEVAPVEKRLTELRGELKAAEARRNGATWASDPMLLVQADPVSWGVSKVIVLAEAELAKRQRQVEISSGPISSIDAAIRDLLVRRAALVSDDVRTTLLKSEREAQAAGMTRTILSLVGRDIEWTWAQELKSRENPSRDAAVERARTDLSREGEARHRAEIAMRQNAPVESMPMGGLVR